VPKPKKNIPGMVFIIIAIVLIGWVLLAPWFFTFRMSDHTAKQLFSQLGIPVKTANINVSGKEIHYVMVGNDSLPTLAFIHGSPSSWHAFIEYMKDVELLKYYRIMGIDRPGFGYSNFGEAMTLQEQAKHILPVFALIQNHKPVYLAGHSLGGPLLIQMAADAPQEFAGIMIISGSVDPALEPKEKWRFLMEKFPFNYMLPGSFRPSNTELVYFKKDVLSLSAEFEKIRCAVYLVHGDKDTWVPPGNVNYAVKKLVHASKVETLILHGGNHFIPWTKKKEITQELIRMLTM
jgi:pimeloyl-ACP methyl ester carboxylesterase